MGQCAVGRLVCLARQQECVRAWRSKRADSEMAEKGTPSVLASTRPLEASLAAVPRSARIHDAWLCVAFREHDRWCSQGATLDFLKEQMAEVVSASPFHAASRHRPRNDGHAAGTIAVLGCKVSSYLTHFRQSPASYRTKALLQESTAFQNNRDGADGSSGRKLSRPARRREKRHPRPWHDADSTQSRIRLQTCSMGGRGGKLSPVQTYFPITWTCATAVRWYHVSQRAVCIAAFSRKRTKSAPLPEFWGLANARGSCLAGPTRR